MVAIVAAFLLSSQARPGGTVLLICVGFVVGTILGAAELKFSVSNPFVIKANKTLKGRLISSIHGGAAWLVSGVISIPLVAALLANHQAEFPGFQAYVAVCFAAGFAGTFLSGFLPTVADIHRHGISVRAAGGLLTGEELRSVREGLGLSAGQMSRVLGYAGDARAGATAIENYEAGVRPIPLSLSRLAIMLGQLGVPETWDEPIQTPVERPNQKDRRRRFLQRLAWQRDKADSDA